MSRFTSGDRARIDSYAGPGSIDVEAIHGRYCTVTTKPVQGSDATIRFDDGTTKSVPVDVLLPAASMDTTLSNREHDTITNIWGEAIPDDLRKVDTAALWEMKQQVGDAVELTYSDDDMEAMGVLCPLEVKISQAISEREAV